MKARETANRIKIVNRITGAEAPPVYIYGKYDDAVKYVRKQNTLVSRFPKRWMAF